MLKTHRTDFSIRAFAALAALAGSLAFWATSASAMNVVTTSTDLASIAKYVGGEFATVEAIAKGSQDPHFIDAKPSTMKTLSKADLFVVIGLEMEIGYLNPLLEGARNPNIQPGTPGYVDASAGVNVLQKPTGVVDRTKGDAHLLGNPHYWLDPLNGAVIAKNIAAGLSAVDPDHAENYRANAEAFSARLKEKLAEWQKTLAPFKGAEIVTYHNSWPYFAERFGLNVIDFVETKPGIPPTPQHLLQLIKKMKSKQVQTILMEPYFSQKAPKTIASKTGAKVVILAPSVGGDKGVIDYFDLFDQLTKEIARALG